MEMPRQDVPVEEWAQWLWRYPQDLLSKPGITHDPSGISLASIRGYLLITGRVPHGEGHQRGQAVFIMRAIELALTPGLYRRTLASLDLTVAIGRSMDRYTNLTENTSVNNVVRFYAQQGISIDEVVDAHVWAERQLRHYSQDDDNARRAEAHLVLQRTHQYASNGSSMVGGNHPATTTGKANGQSAVNDDDERIQTETWLSLLILIVKTTDDGLLSSDRRSCRSISFSGRTRSCWVR
jgi:hypothetical protein